MFRHQRNNALCLRVPVLLDHNAIAGIMIIRNNFVKGGREVPKSVICLEKEAEK